MEAILGGAPTTLRSATGLITESFDALHFIPVHGIGTGTDFEQAEAASPNLGQRFTGGIDQFTFQISLVHDNYLSVAASARGTAWGKKQVASCKVHHARNRSVDLVDASEPAGGEPRLLGGKSFGPMVEGTEQRAVDGREIGSPMTISRRFDVAGTANFERAECG